MNQSHTELAAKARAAAERLFNTNDGMYTAIETLNKCAAALESPERVLGEAVAWYEYHPDHDAWFLAYTQNPKAKTRPLIFGDAVVATPSPQAEKQPLSDKQIEVLRFLDGVGDLNGFGFGVKPPTERGNYWWRKNLRAAFPDVDFGIVTKESTNG